MKILFAIRNDGADAYFRAIAPASMLRYQGVEAKARGASIEDADEYDVLILQRQCSPVAELIMREFQERGKPVIYDTDDWLGGMPPFWPSYDEYFERGRGEPKTLLLMHERLLRKADLVTCPTNALAEKMLKFNKHVAVLPNCVMWADWDIVIPDEKQIEGPIVGWFGMPYYWDTWRMIAEAVEQAVCEVGGHLSILGYPEVVHCFSDRLAKRTFVQPMCSWRRFGTMRKMIASFDMGIAWLEDTAFNRCKSPLKALQYGAAGVPLVASPTVYSEVLSGEYPGEFGALAGDPASLYHGIVKIVEQNGGASSMRAEKWRERIWERHTYEARWGQWLHTIREVCPD